MSRLLSGKARLGEGFSRREVLSALGLSTLAGACGGPYVMPSWADGGAPGVEPSLAMSRHDYFERDVSAYLPSGLTGRYYFGGGFLGREGIEPQSVLVELDAERGLLRRASYTYAVRRGEPFTDLGGEGASQVLEVVRQIAGRIHQAVAVPERGEVHLFPAAGAPAVVDASTLALRSSFGSRVFYADNFSAHPHYEASERAMYYTRLDVIANMDASLDGEPERYRHSLVRRQLDADEEEVLIEGIVGPIVHTVERSPDGRLGVIVFTGDGIRRPFGRRGGQEDLARRTKATAESSGVLVFDWHSREVLGRFKTHAVPVHVAFDHPDDDGTCNLFVQCVNTTFVDSPPTWYGYGAYQKLKIAGPSISLAAQYDDPKICNVPHSLKMSDDGGLLWSTNAESSCVLALDPRTMEPAVRVAFEPLSSRHDQRPRGIEQSVDGRYLLVSSNTSLHFYDLEARRWVGKPIGVVIGERHAHAARG